MYGGERNRAEWALRDCQSLYTYLYENAAVMMHTLDQCGRLVDVNNAWLRTMGYKLHEVLGRKGSSFLTSASRTYAESVAIPTFFETGRATDIPYTFVKADGETLDVLLYASSVRNGKGDVVRGNAVLIDLTKLTKAERQAARRDGVDGA